MGGARRAWENAKRKFQDGHGALQFSLLFFVNQFVSASRRKVGKCQLEEEEGLEKVGWGLEKLKLDGGWKFGMVVGGREETR